jgi:hypothetical protein
MGVSSTNQRFADELAALRPTRRSRIGLRAEGVV